MNAQEVTRRGAQLPATGDPRQWSEQEKALITAAGLVFRHTYGQRAGQVEPAPRAVVEQFLHMARRSGLDPLARQVYCIGRLSHGQVTWSIQTSIDGFRVIAERSGQYAGQGPSEWLAKDGEWTQVWVKELHGEYPLAARATVYRHDFTQPLTAVATWDAYAQTKTNGELTSMWQRMGPLMLAKCAEALALRKAFPQDLSGLYTGDEMSQAEVPDAIAAPTSLEADNVGVVEQQEEAIPTDEVGGGERDWLAAIRALSTVQEAEALWREARDAGQLDTQLQDEQNRSARLADILMHRGGQLRDAEENPADASAASPVADSGDSDVVQGELMGDGDAQVEE